VSGSGPPLARTVAVAFAPPVAVPRDLCARARIVTAASRALSQYGFLLRPLLPPPSFTCCQILNDPNNNTPLYV